MTTASIPSEQRFLLDDVDWPFYESLLQRVGDRHIFVTYDRGRLELMSPSWKHDKRARLIGLIVNIVAEDLRIPFEGGGSTTFRREDLQQGLEPDQCFYIQHVAQIRGKDEIDLASDPPPDLAVEVEISQRMVRRIPIYQSLGVPELWRDDGRHVRVYHLEGDGEYHELEHSVAFPMLSTVQIDYLLDLARNTDEMNWTTAVREWVRKNLARQ
ncbi:MAG: Uma2 family endonuclease [Bacillota bacterium]